MYFAQYTYNSKLHVFKIKYLQKMMKYSHSLGMDPSKTTQPKKFKRNNQFIKQNIHF